MFADRVKGSRGVALPLFCAIFLGVVAIKRLLHVSILSAVLPDLKLMTFLTASNLFIYALALVFAAHQRPVQSRWTTLLGLLYALINFYDWSNGIELFAAPSPATAWMLLLLGCSIFLSQSNSRDRYRYAGELLAGFAITLAFAGILGRTVSQFAEEGLGPFVTTSFYTSLMVILLAFSSLQLTKGGAVKGLLYDQGLPGRFVRGLTLVILALNIFNALLANPEVGPAIFSTSSDLLLIFSILLAIKLIAIFSMGEMFRREAIHAEIAEEHAVQTNAYLEKTLEIAPIGIMTADEFGRIYSANPAACRIHGYPTDSLVGMRMTELVPVDRRTDFSLLWSDLFKTGKEVKLGKSGELKALKQDGSEAFIEFYVTFVEFGGERTAVCAVNDVSQQVELRRQLERWNLELQERVAERTNELSRANEELLQRNSELQQFTYAASHDLQSPLRGIGVYAGVIKDDYGDRLDEEGIQYIDFVVAEAKRLQQLISDLLTYSKISSRSTEGFEPVDLNEVLSEVRDQLARVITDVDYRVELGPLPTVPGVKSLLVQLFYNLIENAIKYRGEAPLLVTIKNGVESQGYTSVIEVADNGMGIAPEHLDRIFEVFKRLHSQEAIPGTGIGLSICKRIAERHGGGIEVSSEVGIGTTFTVRIANQPAKVVS